MRAERLEQHPEPLALLVATDEQHRRRAVGVGHRGVDEVELDAVEEHLGRQPAARRDRVGGVLAHRGGDVDPAATAAGSPGRPATYAGPPPPRWNVADGRAAVLAEQVVGGDRRERLVDVDDAVAQGRGDRGERPRRASARASRARASRSRGPRRRRPTAACATPAATSASSVVPGEQTTTSTPRRARSRAIARTWVWTPPGTLSA